MTNEEIIGTINEPYKSVISGCMNLARADEREKMQGLDVWVSWDKHRRQEVYPVLTFTEPSIESRPSYFTYYKTDDETYAELTPKEAETLGVTEGQCKKFRIVEVLT